MGMFKEEDIELARKVESTYGIPVSVTLGQYAVESGYGEHTSGTNNYFNIKTSGGGYADYESKEASFMAYGQLLSNERYTQNTSRATSIEDYVTGVYNSGYAEDPEYVEKVLSVIEINNLYDLDNKDSTKPFLSQNSQYSTIGGTVEGSGLEWWGDIVVVVFAILIVIAGVIFIGLAVTGSSPLGEVTKAVKKVKSGNIKELVKGVE